MLRSFGYLARRSVTTTASRQLSEGTGVSRDAKEFVRLLKTDRMLAPLLLAFCSIFGVAHYSVSLGMDWVHAWLLYYIVTWCLYSNPGGHYIQDS